MSEETAEAAELPDETAIGRLALRVDDLDRVVPFYRDVLGFEVDRTDSTARFSVEGGRELLVLAEDPDAPSRPRSAAGLFHVAIRFPDRTALADALGRIRLGGVTISGASDHLVSEALYLRDPAGNGVELYWDRPRETWTRRDDGLVEMDTLPLDVEDLAASGGDDPTGPLPSKTDVGHVHLEVADLATSTAFYVDGLGFRRSSGDYPGASFLSAGGYHHHLGLNVWNRRSAPVGDHQGLAWFEVVLPDEASREATARRLLDAGFDASETGGGVVTSDPDGIQIRLVVE